MPGFTTSTLVALYDQGRLVPFIGSGISAGPCVDWPTMIGRLRNAAGLPACDASPGTPGYVQARAAAPAVLALRCSGRSLADSLRTDLYDQVNGFGRNELLAKLAWPLICTTNYDDTYFGARIQRARKLAHRHPGVRRDLNFLPRVYGRSETDCRRVLQHMASPAGEVYWAVQGMLTPRPHLLEEYRAVCAGKDDKLPRVFRAPELEPELVVGPVEYRVIANRAEHFRRAFAEMFYHRSLLFLGTGLSEPYFLSLFDEAVEMLGPPSRPHFALVDKNKVDVDHLRTHYNIICRTYDGPAEHRRLDDLLNDLVREVRSARPKPHNWGYCMNRGSGAAAGQPHFSVEATPLPKLPSTPGEVLVISVGRKSASKDNYRGDPLPGTTSRHRVAGPSAGSFGWINDSVGRWSGIKQLYAVAARDTWSQVDVRSRDLRSPEAVRVGFRAFLDYASANDVTVVRSMLLAAGQTRTFEPWVSLAQMARAYGEWHAAWSKTSDGEPVKVVVHAVTEDLLAMLRTGQLSLAERLQGNTEIRFKVEIIDGDGNVHVEPYVGGEDDTMGSLPALRLVPMMEPALGVVPHGRPSRVLREFTYAEILTSSLKNFGIVTGSTVIVNYRRKWGEDVDDL